MNPKVSIVIPVYNGENYMREAIDSALAQSYKNIEVIVVNDGSKDGGKTEEIAKGYGNLIRYFSKPNGGVATALNLAIKEMTGDYFSWLSHDDIYYPNKIEVQVKFIEQQKAPVILYSDIEMIEEESKMINITRYPHIDPKHFRVALVKDSIINGCTLLIPKICFETHGVFNECLRYTQDYDLWFRLSEKYWFIHQPEVLVKSRQHPQQDSRAKNTESIKECNEIEIEFLHKLGTEEIIAATGKAIPQFYAEFAVIMKQRKWHGAKWESMRRSILTFHKQSFEQMFKTLKSIVKLIIL
jgi:glycosyltransferase involved in cell wall biosynthesis